MSYMLLIVEEPDQRGTRTLEEGQALYDRMLQWGAELRDEGVLLASESLVSMKEAARVKVRAGKAQVLDGPFAEVKEMVGGFYLVDCNSREEAVALAARCPAAAWATVEVREVAPCYR